MRHGHVTGNDVIQQGVVSGPLNIGFTAQGVDTAARNTDVAQQQLNDTGGTNVLHADRMLGPTQSIHDGSGLVLFTGGREVLVDLQQICGGHAGCGGNRINVVARVVLLEQLEHATGILEALVPLGNAVGIQFKAPLALVIGAGLFIITGEQAVLETEILAHDERGIGILGDIFMEVQIILKDVLDHAPEEGDIRTGSQGNMEIRSGGSTRELRVHMHDSGTLVLGLQHPLE